jgi:tetratricopeptide (TPR) repeat protein
MQVVVSHFQAGRICDYINRQWGYAKLLEMMRDFGAGASTPEVIEKRLGIKPEEFDRRFLAALEGETKKTVAGFEEWRKRLKAAQELRRQAKYDEAIREASAARDLYPEYVEPGSAYELLADAYEAKGNRPAAIPELERYAKMGGRNPAALKLLATLQEAAGRQADAAATLDRLNYIAPMDEDVHRRLGDLWMALGRNEGAIREYRAVVAREPTDPAAAHFALARALRAGGRPVEAKDEVLAALEAAPGYRPAQKMLLELSK